MRVNFIVYYVVCAAVLVLIYCKLVHVNRSTVEAVPSKHPQEIKKLSATGASHLLRRWPTGACPAYNEYWGFKNTTKFIVVVFASCSAMRRDGAMARALASHQ